MYFRPAENGVKAALSMMPLIKSEPPLKNQIKQLVSMSP